MLKIFKFSLIVFVFSISFGCASNGCTSIFSNNETLVKAKYKISAKYIDEKQKRPTIIVAHGCDGVSNSSYSSWARRIESWGYNAILVDSFSGRGYSNVCSQPYMIMPKERADDLIEVAAMIKEQPWHTGPIGVIGFSHGGSTAINIAAREQQTNVDFTIAFYPGCYWRFAGANVDNVRVPTQLHLAEKDDWTPYTQCFSKEKNIEQYLYLGATHAFDMPYPPRNYQGYWLQYNKSADQESTARTKKFIDKMSASKIN